MWQTYCNEGDMDVGGSMDMRTGLVVSAVTGGVLVVGVELSAACVFDIMTTSSSEVVDVGWLAWLADEYELGMFGEDFASAGLSSETVV